MRSILAILVLGIFCSSQVWARGAYKWTDDAGIVHYSDRALGKPSSVINLPVPQMSDTLATETPPLAPRTEDRSPAQVEKDPGTEQARERELFRRNCIKAREQLAINQRLGRMYRLVGEERHYLSDAERASVIKQSVDVVSYWCKKQP